jgi:hypothetical protein
VKPRFLAGAVALCAILLAPTAASASNDRGDDWRKCADGVHSTKAYSKKAKSKRFNCDEQQLRERCGEHRDRGYAGGSAERALWDGCGAFVHHDRDDQPGDHGGKPDAKREYQPKYEEGSNLEDMPTYEDMPADEDTRHEGDDESDDEDTEHEGADKPTDEDTRHEGDDESDDEDTEHEGADEPTYEDTKHEGEGEDTPRSGDRPECQDKPHVGDTPAGGDTPDTPADGDTPEDDEDELV